MDFYRADPGRAVRDNAGDRTPKANDLNLNGHVRLKK